MTPKKEVIQTLYNELVKLELEPVKFAHLITLIEFQLDEREDKIKELAGSLKLVTLTEEDVPEDKREIFRMLHGPMVNVLKVLHKKED